MDTDFSVNSGQDDQPGLAHRLMSVMLDVLRKRLEFGFLQQLTESTLTVPVGSEVLSVMFAQVFDFGGGMLVVDLPAFVTRTTVKARILRGFAHLPSFAALAGWLVWAAVVKRHRWAVRMPAECGTGEGAGLPDGTGSVTFTAGLDRGFEG